MYFVAGLLALMAGLFYGASNHAIGAFGKTLCLYGDTFCDHPVYLLVAAGIAALWGAFVSVR